MTTADCIIRSATEFYDQLRSDENGRFRSWEHCYSHFMNARRQANPDFDYLSLQLAFYLASWGMYRGSSFLLQKDYRVHIPAVKVILDSKYDLLAGIECVEYRRPEIQQLLKEINAYLDEISTYLQERISPTFDKYGIKLVSFFVNDINISKFSLI